MRWRPDEPSIANRNDAVVEVLKLAYEPERTVARQRNRKVPLETIYVPTALDENPRLDIVADRYGLVLVTGNPGRGRSASLGRLF